MALQLVPLVTDGEDHLAAAKSLSNITVAKTKKIANFEEAMSSAPTYLTLTGPCMTAIDRLRVCEYYLFRTLLRPTFARMNNSLSDWFSAGI